MSRNEKLNSLFNIRVLFETRLLKELNRRYIKGENVVAELDEYSKVTDILFDKLIFGIREPFNFFYGLYSINEEGKKLHKDYLYFFYDKRWTFGSVALIIYNRMKDLTPDNLENLTETEFRNLFHKVFNIYVRFVETPLDFDYKSVLILSH